MRILVCHNFYQQPGGEDQVFADETALLESRGHSVTRYTVHNDAVAKTGHTRNSIHNVKTGIFTRGILIDIPRLKGVPYLEPGTPIYVSDIEAWEKRAGVRVGPGDAVFVRTGVWARRKAVGPWLRGRAEGGRSAGLDPSVIPWLRQRDVAVMGSDHPSTSLRAVPARHAAPSTTSRSSIWACRSSTTATSRRSPTRPRRASDGPSCSRWHPCRFAAARARP